MYNYKYHQIGSVVILTLALALSACKKGGDIITNPPAGDQNSDKWVSNIPFCYNSLSDSLPHDNRIYESANFLTFSDGSSDEVKKQYSGMAEGSLAMRQSPSFIAGDYHTRWVEQDMF